ncbi:MAG: orotate phosphoribosyltransferase, partial [Alcanivorax sp.]|nr:orotate phosphoribosyltransferase [Alcanivorax sp.]
FLLMFVVIGGLLLPIIGIFWLIMTIIAAVKANGGERYRYPLTIRLIK